MIETELSCQWCRLRIILAEFSNPYSFSYVVLLGVSISMRSFIRLTCFIIAMSTMVCQCCRCKKKPLHEAFCDADFAILAKVTTQKRIMEYQRHLYNFRIQPTKIFRQKTPVFIKGMSMVVFTPRSENLCHAKVKRGELYLLGGRVKGRRVFLTSCGLIQKWHSLQHVIRKSIRLGKISCRCSVQGCNGQKCLLRSSRLKRPMSHSCENVSIQQKSCYAQYGVCIYKNKRCKWAKRSLKLISHCLSQKTLNYVNRGR